MENKQNFVKAFCKKYTTTTSEHVKGDMIKKIIKVTYVPVMMKRAALQRMLDISIVVTGHGTDYIDMFLSRINMIMCIVGLYTDLKVEKDGDGLPLTFEAYDALTESGVLAKIYEQIPEQELAELTSINGVLMDNFYNERTVENFVAKQLSRVSALVGSFAGSGLNELRELLKDKEKVENLAESLGDFLEVEPEAEGDTQE